MSEDITALIAVAGRIATALESLHQALVPEPTSRERYQGEQPTPYLEQLVDTLGGLYPLKDEMSELEHRIQTLHNLQEMFAVSATFDSQQLRKRLDALEGKEE